MLSVCIMLIVAEMIAKLYQKVDLYINITSYLVKRYSVFKYNTVNVGRIGVIIIFVIFFVMYFIKDFNRYIIDMLLCIVTGIWIGFITNIK